MKLRPRQWIVSECVAAVETIELRQSRMVVARFIEAARECEREPNCCWRAPLNETIAQSRQLDGNRSRASATKDFAEVAVTGIDLRHRGRSGFDRTAPEGVARDRRDCFGNSRDDPPLRLSRMYLLRCGSVSPGRKEFPFQ